MMGVPTPDSWPHVTTSPPLWNAICGFGITPVTGLTVELPGHSIWTIAYQIRQNTPHHSQRLQ